MIVHAIEQGVTEEVIADAPGLEVQPDWLQDTSSPFAVSHGIDRDARPPKPYKNGAMFRL